METMIDQTDNYQCKFHKLKLFKCTFENCEKLAICKFCCFNSKEELQHLADHYDNLKEFLLINNSQNQINLKNEDLYADLNKYLSEEAFNKIDSTTDTIFNSLNYKSKIINEQVRQNFNDKYDLITIEFETLVKNLSEKIGKISTLDSKAKDEVKKMKKELDEKIQFFGDKNLFSKDFEETLNKVDKNIRSKEIQYILDGKFNFNDVGKSLDLSWENGSSLINTSSKGGSYWCVRSNETLNGQFLCKVKILSIDSSAVTSYWNYCFGVCKLNLRDQNTYYNDSLIFQSNGYISKEFTGSGSHLQLFNGQDWKTGDELLLKRDENNNIYFGINSETSLKLAFSNQPEPFKIVMGFSSVRNGDSFSMIELNQL
jgi:hypothetical protein